MPGLWLIKNEPCLSGKWGGDVRRVGVYKAVAVVALATIKSPRQILSLSLTIDQLSMSEMTFPWTSVNRKSRPLERKVRR